MLSTNSLDEISEIYCLLEDIKQEYNKGFKTSLVRNHSLFYSNIHSIPKLKKIQINRGLGLSAQSSNVLKKSVSEFRNITGQKPIITKAKKAIASFKIRDNMDLGLTVTLRGKKMYAFLTKLIFFTFAQIRDFRGLSVRSFDKAGNYTLGFKEQLIFPEISYDEVDQTKGLNITLVIDALIPKRQKHSFQKILNGLILFKFLRFPLNDCGYYGKYLSFSEITKVWERKKHLKRKRWSHN